MWNADCGSHWHFLRIGQGGLQWKVRLCLLVAVAAETSIRGHVDATESTSQHSDHGDKEVEIKSARGQNQGPVTKQLIRDGPPGEWGSSFRAPAGLAPLEKPDRDAVARAQEQAKASMGWGAWAASLLGAGDGESYHDGDVWDEEYNGDETLDGEGEGAEAHKEKMKIRREEEERVSGGESGWQEVKLERVECEVPIRVWPGNTAFKAMEVVFDV
jgi:hypothetical protein